MITALQLRTFCLATALTLGGSLATDLRAQSTPAPTDTPLTTPSLSVASGTDILVAGVGLGAAPYGTVHIDIPTGATVKQVLAYWEGQDIRGTEHTTTDTIYLGAAPLSNVAVVGNSIGGPHLFYSNAHSTVFRADITGLGLVANGSNDIAVTGFDFTGRNDGFGLVVIVDDGSTRKIDVRDGNDLAFFKALPPLDQTTPVTFEFAAATVSRDATISHLAGSVSQPRPTVIEVRDGDGNLLAEEVDALGDTAGPEFDAYQHTVTVPAGVTKLSVQVLSKDATTGRFRYRYPASLSWIVAGLSMDQPAKPCKPLALRMRYTGEDCSASNHNQAPERASCSGNPAFAPRVVVLASNSKRPFSRCARTLFCGVVTLGGEFTIRGRGARRLPRNMYIHVMDSCRRVLQTIKFDASGKEPLASGNQFGSMLVTGLVCKQGKKVSCKRIRPCWKKRSSIKRACAKKRIAKKRCAAKKKKRCAKKKRSAKKKRCVKKKRSAKKKRCAKKKRSDKKRCAPKKRSAKKKRCAKKKRSAKKRCKPKKRIKRSRRARRNCRR